MGRALTTGRVMINTEEGGAVTTRRVMNTHARSLRRSINDGQSDEGVTNVNVRTGDAG